MHMHMCDMREMACAVSLHPVARQDLPDQINHVCSLTGK